MIINKIARQLVIVSVLSGIIPSGAFGPVDKLKTEFKNPRQWVL